jgi:hypothetical protein
LFRGHVVSKYCQSAESRHFDWPIGEVVVWLWPRSACKESSFRVGG